jgi:hypothetical protein
MYILYGPKGERAQDSNGKRSLAAIGLFCLYIRSLLTLKYLYILYGPKGERAQDSNGKRGRFASYSGLRGPRSHEGQGAQVCQCQKRPNIEAKETYSGQRATVTYEDQGRMKVKKLRYASVSRSLLPL